VVNKINRRGQQALEAERPYLKALPCRRTRDYTEYVVPVVAAGLKARLFAAELSAGVESTGLTGTWCSRTSGHH
jgi:hypothetical protein